MEYNSITSIIPQVYSETKVYNEMVNFLDIIQSPIITVGDLDYLCPQVLVYNTGDAIILHKQIEICSHGGEY